MVKKKSKTHKQHTVDFAFLLSLDYCGYSTNVLNQQKDRVLLPISFTSIFWAISDFLSYATA